MHALYSIRKIRNIWVTAIICTSYRLRKEISKERQEVFGLLMMTD